MEKQNSFLGTSYPTNSRHLANDIGMRHAQVLDDIHLVITSLPLINEDETYKEVAVRHGFKKIKYWNAEKKRVQYQLTAKAALLLTMRYTVPEAVKVKLAFIEESERMKSEIQAQSELEESFSDARMYNQLETDLFYAFSKLVKAVPRVAPASELERIKTESSLLKLKRSLGEIEELIRSRSGFKES